MEVSQKKTKHSISTSDFMSMVNGEHRKLVVLDNKVLEYTEFDYFHPGGKFTLN